MLQTTVSNIDNIVKNITKHNLLVDNMVYRLQAPPSSTLSKRKSDNDMGERVAAELEVHKDAEAQRKSNWEHKRPRQRVRRYCCECDDKKARGKNGTCIICDHECEWCSECLARRSGRETIWRAEKMEYNILRSSAC
jgi:hypothetical protein